APAIGAVPPRPRAPAAHGRAAQRRTRARPAAAAADGPVPLPAAVLRAAARPAAPLAGRLVRLLERSLLLHPGQLPLFVRRHLVPDQPLRRRPDAPGRVVRLSGRAACGPRRP